MAVKTFSLGNIDIPTAGTRVQISSTDTPVTSVVFQAHESNAGKIYVGDDAVAVGRGISLSAGESIAISADFSGRPGGDEMILSDWYVDAATNGDDVRVLYTKRR